MAKRKRLEPARGITPPPEMKSALGPSMRPPIADVAQDAASHAAFVEVSTALTKARETGRLVQDIPLDQIDVHYLMRDRFVGDIDTEEMDTLIASLKERGQQTPIEVSAADEDGMYGLISGWRRLHALLQLRDENPKIDTVLALVRRPDDMAEAYRAMVDENEIRADLSTYERAAIVVRARKAGVFQTTKGALGQLFGTVSRSRRSKINSFIAVVEQLDSALRFPKAIPERLGLAMAKALEEDAGFAARLQGRLAATVPDTATAELSLIQGALRPDTPPAPAKPKPETTYIREGLTMTIHPEGRVVLEGERMSEPHMLKALRRALDSL